MNFFTGLLAALAAFSTVSCTGEKPVERSYFLQKFTDDKEFALFIENRQVCGILTTLISEKMSASATFDPLFYSRVFEVIALLIFSDNTANIRAWANNEGVPLQDILDRASTYAAFFPDPIMKFANFSMKNIPLDIFRFLVFHRYAYGLCFENMPGLDVAQLNSTQLRDLSVLIIKDQKLEKIPRMDHLVSLTLLGLPGNNIQKFSVEEYKNELTGEYKHMYHVHNLSLSGNPIGSVDPNIPMVFSLNTNVTLKNTRFGRLPQTLTVGWVMNYLLRWVPKISLNEWKREKTEEEDAVEVLEEDDEVDGSEV